jgi:hypothetical protein
MGIVPGLLAGLPETYSVDATTIGRLQPAHPS